MWAPYDQAACGKLPHAKVVVDRFHVMKQLNTRLTQLRTKYQKESTDEMKNLLKGSRWILVRNRAELSPKETEHLDNILKTCPDLRSLYLLKEEFRTVFEKIHCREKAARFLDAWVIKANEQATNTCSNLLPHSKIGERRSSIISLKRITNGFVRGAQ